MTRHRYRIWVKETQVSPSPDESWPTVEGAQESLREIEESVPQLRGKLVVRMERG